VREESGKAISMIEGQKHLGEMSREVAGSAQSATG